MSNKPYARLPQGFSLNPEKRIAMPYGISNILIPELTPYKKIEIYTPEYLSRGDLGVISYFADEIPPSAIILGKIRPADRFSGDQNLTPQQIPQGELEQLIGAFITELSQKNNNLDRLRIYFQPNIITQTEDIRGY